MCNIYTNEHFWVIGSNTSKVSAPLVGQPCQCGAVLWGDRPTPHALDGATAERTMSVSCPHCNRQVEIVLLVSPRK